MIFLLLNHASLLMKIFRNRVNNRNILLWDTKYPFRKINQIFICYQFADFSQYRKIDVERERNMMCRLRFILSRISVISGNRRSLEENKSSRREVREKGKALLPIERGSMPSKQFFEWPISLARIFTANTAPRIEKIIEWHLKKNISIRNFRRRVESLFQKESNFSHIPLCILILESSD